MGTIIIAMPRESDSRRIAEIMKARSQEHPAICRTASEVLEKAGNSEFGLVICGAKLTDMNYLELYEYLPDSFEMLLLSSKIDDSPPEIARLPVPFHSSDICQLTSMILAQQTRRYRKVVSKKKVSEENLIIIGRAKEILMRERNMTEPEAHRFIQKMSMDSGCDSLETAWKVIDMYKSKE